MKSLGGGPAELRHDVDAPPLVGLVLVGVQRDARGARVAEDCNQLLSGLKPLALRKVDAGRGSPPLGS